MVWIARIGLYFNSLLRPCSVGTTDIVARRIYPRVNNWRAPYTLRPGIGKGNESIRRVVQVIMVRIADEADGTDCTDFDRGFDGWYGLHGLVFILIHYYDPVP